MEPSVAFEPSRNRWEVVVDGEVAGFAECTREGDLLSFTHTVVDPRYEGRGLGGVLVREALAAVEAQGAKVLPYCSFVRSYLERHPERLHLVPDDQRSRFGFPAA